VTDSNGRRSEPPDATKGVFAISVVAEMVGTGVQNLRLYERRGLLEPSRSAGGTRLYSADDVERLRRILTLLDGGLNLAGVAMVLELQDDLHRLRGQPGRRRGGQSGPGPRDLGAE